MLSSTRCKVQLDKKPVMKSKLWFSLFALSAIFFGLYPILYFIIDRHFGLLQTKDVLVLQNLFWNIGFYTHIVFGGSALLIGWTQFFEQWRKVKPNVHRQIGKLYIVFVLLSSVSGIFIGFFATGGFVAAVGFICLGIVWLFSTILAYQYIRKGSYEIHKKLMTYSYASCFAAVTLRIWLPLLTLVFDDFFIAYKIVAWLCWTPNILVAYLINRQQGSS